MFALCFIKITTKLSMSNNFFLSGHIFSMISYQGLVTILFYFYPKLCCSTIDINAAELQYLADHLTPEECRRLVAAAHFRSFEEPNALDNAERKVPKDLKCIEHLLHWNSQDGEGKGQTHEVLEHRLRQMGKIELADWLGRTVFHQLGVDLEKSIKEGMDDMATEEPSTDPPQITLEPLVPKIEEPTKYTIFDSLLYAFAVGMVLTIFGLCFKLLLWDKVSESIRKKKLRKSKSYDFIETDTSGSDSEENKFDVRTYTSSSYITR